MVCGAFRSFPRLGLVWVRRLTPTLTQTALKPKWRKIVIFEAFLETKHPVFLRKPGASGYAVQKRRHIHRAISKIVAVRKKLIWSISAPTEVGLLSNFSNIYSILRKQRNRREIATNHMFWQKIKNSQNISHSLPRSASHLRDPGLTERRGRENRLRHAGPQQRRLHPGDLHPHHHGSPAPGSRHHGKPGQRGDKKT